MQLKVSLLIVPTDVSRLTLIGPAWVACLALATPGDLGGGWQGRTPEGQARLACQCLEGAEVGAAPSTQTGLRLGGWRAPKRRMDSDVRGEDVGWQKRR